MVFFLNVTLILRWMVRLYGQWGQMKKKSYSSEKKKEKKEKKTNNK